MITKIHPDLLNKVSTLNNESVNCFLYAKDFHDLKNKLDNHKIKYVDYPFMNCFYVTLNKSAIIKLSRCESVDFITKSTKVFTLIDRAKQFINIDKIDFNT